MKRKPRGDEPAPDDLESKAGELQVGSYSHSWLYDKDRKLPPKGVFGFRAPEGRIQPDA